LTSRRLAAPLCFSALLLAGATLADDQIELQTLDGAPVTIDLAVDAQAVVLHFWATWCPSCVDELAVLDRMVSACSAAIRIVAVNVGESPSTVRRFASENAIQSEVLLDRQGRVFRRLGGRGLPTNYLQSAGKGSTLPGPRSEEAWRELLGRFGCPP